MAEAAGKHSSAAVDERSHAAGSAVARTLLNRRMAAQVPAASELLSTPRLPEAAPNAPKLRRGKSRRNLKSGDDEDVASPGKEGEGTAAFPASYDNHQADSETTRLLYDPDNPDALRAVLQRLDIGAGDQRVVYQPELEVVPAWVHRWCELRLYATDIDTQWCGRPGMPLPAAGTSPKSIMTFLEGARLRLQHDMYAAQQLRAEIQAGVDGGYFGVGSRAVETPNRHPGDPFWTELGIAERFADDLVGDFQRSMSLCEEALRTHALQHPTAASGAPLGLQGSDGFLTDGSQHRLLSSASLEAQRSVAQRVVMESVCDSNAQWGRREGGPAAISSRTDASLMRLYGSVPVIHDRFVVEPDVSRIMDPLAIRDPEMLTSPQTLAEVNAVRRSFTVHIPFLRFREHADFSREQQFAAQLLDAYEQYQLLTANLKPELKSRTFYRQLLVTLDAQAHMQQQQQHLAMPSAAQETAHAAQTREAYAAQQKQQSASIHELYQRSVEAERACLHQMISSWKLLSAVREAQGFRSVRLTMGMRRHGAVHQQQMTGLNSPEDANHNDILQFVPVLTDADLPLMPGAAPSLGATTDAVGPMPTPPPPPCLSTAAYFVSVYARTSTTLPPKFVGSTASRPLNTTATVHLNETFELRTQHDPTELILQIVREDGNVVVASVRIPASTTQAALLLPFTTGTYFADSETGETKQVGGIISVATSWTTCEGHSIEAIERMFLRGEADPLDPRNERFVQLLRTYYTETSPPTATSGNEASGAGVGGSSSNAAQRYRHGEGGLYLPLPPALGARHELLRRRWLIASREDCAVDELEAKLVDQAVPLEDNQVKRMYRELKKQVDAAKATAASQAAAALGQASAALALSATMAERLSAEEQRNLHRHRLWQQGIKNVKLMHRSRRRLADHEKLAKHVVLPPLPTFRGVFQYFIDTFSPQSNFNPRRENREEAVDIDRSKLVGRGGASSHILVHVMKAANLPMRDDGTELEPQVEASFVAHTACGRTEAGCNPSWFESLKVRFDPPDFDEDTLALIDDMIVLSVYDRLRITLPPASATLGAIPEITHYRVERRLLGTVKIPFYTLYTTKKASLEGLYTLVTPRWIMGYHVPRGAPSTLQLYVALNPPLCRERQVTPCLMSDLGILPVAPELHQVHFLAFQWREKVSALLQQLILFENPNAVWRSVDPFVPNSVGDPTLICRFILPHGGPPPPTVTTVPSALRFVALQRFEVDMVTWGDRDVWSTNAEFLAKGRGDYEELALLLVHLLRHLAPQSQTYLLIGKGNHYHQSAFVLHVINGDWKIIDPRTGNICDAHDPHGELAEVSMVVSHDQVYANIQLSGTPYRMLWDLNDQRYWLPMVPNDMPTPLRAAMQEPLQREHLVFRPPLEQQALIIEDNLKRCVKKALKTWRNDRQPPYQERVGTILREVLEELERERRECANYQQPAVDEVHRKALHEFEGEYVAIGNPVCAAYQPDDNFANILDSVFETAVHRVGTDAVRYGLATYAYPFTEHTVAIWVYLVALVPRSIER